jgi:hypothetical protein
MTGQARTPYNPSAARGQLPAIPLATAAGQAAIGNPSGSGRVPGGIGFGPYDGGGRSSELPFVLSSDAPILVDLPPDSLYVTRAMRGGAVSFPAFGQFKPKPPLMGGFEQIAFSPAAAPLDGDQMEPQSLASPTTWRDAPPVVDLCRRTPNYVGTGA